jgi:hypothetical protein
MYQKRVLDGKGDLGLYMTIPPPPKERAVHQPGLYT